MDTLLCLYSYNIHFTLRLFAMSKKISKKVSAIRTISLAVGSLSLLVIAVSQVIGNKACTSNAFSIEKQIRLSWVIFILKIHIIWCSQVNFSRDIFIASLIILGTSSIVGYFYQIQIALVYALLNVIVLLIWSKLASS